MMDDITNSKLKVIFYVHFILIVLSQVGAWGEIAYLFYNLIFIFCLLWSLFDQNAAESVQHAILIDAMAIIFDIILLALGYPHDGHSSARFSAAMAIINLLIRPFSIIVLHRILQERNGSLGALENVGNFFTPPQRNYQDIDKHESVPTASHSDQDFFSRPAQQI